MATRYNLEAERKQDYIIEETQKVQDDQWLQTVNRPGPFPGPWHDPAQITNKIDLPPRVIRLHLQSGSVVERTAKTMTWALSFPQMENLRAGTIVHWVDFLTTGAETPWIELAISGVRTIALRTNTNEPYAFIAGGTFTTLGEIVVGIPGSLNRVVDLPSFLQFGNGATPICSTLQDLDILNNGSITLHNRNNDDMWDEFTALATTLLFVEPGASIWG